MAQNWTSIVEFKKIFSKLYIYIYIWRERERERTYKFELFLVIKKMLINIKYSNSLFI